MIVLLALDMTQWLLLTLGVIALNVIPAFMPPTWTLLAYMHIHEGTSIWALSAVGAIGTTTGRGLLAWGSRHFGERIVPRRWRHNIRALVDTIRSRRALSLSTLALFALGPVPTNHLFIAVGIAATPLPLLLFVFGVARFLSYLIWISVLQTAVNSLDEAIRPSWGNGAALAAQMIGFALLVLAMQFNWSRFLKRTSATSTTPPEHHHADK